MLLLNFTVRAQSTTTTTTTTTTSTNQVSNSAFGHALNLGIGIGGYGGYYGYIGQSLPVFNVNYEFDLARNFTLAPFISFSQYKNSYYWGNKNHPYKVYYFKETVIPIGLKASYYFDELLNANSKWDFYLAASLGFAFINSSWDDDYYGDKDYYNHGNPLFFDLHFGTEYHISNKIGLILDLSTGVSTIGIAIH